MKKPTNAAIAVATPSPLSPAIREKIQEWQKLVDYLKQGKETEMELRKELANLFISSPKEGTNRIEGEGFEVKLVHKLTRTLQEDSLDVVMQQLPEDYRILGNLIKYKPTFDVKVYGSMSAENKKIFEQALEIKDAAPTLEIILREDAKV